MPSIASAYRGPLVIIGLGSGFSVVGAVPVAITFSIGVKTSATIIGMGFVGFGFLLILPGLFWCIMVRTHSFKFWRRRKRTSHKRNEEDEEEEEETPALNNKYDKNTLNSTPRERRWPPAYVGSPPLIITDHCVTGLHDDGLTPTVVTGNAAGLTASDCSYDNDDCQSDNGNVDNATTIDDDVDNNNTGNYVTAAADNARTAALQSVDIHCAGAAAAPGFEPASILASV